MSSAKVASTARMPLRSKAGSPVRVTMLLENNIYPDDIRVRAEAQSLARAGYEVTVIAPRGPGQRRREVATGGVRVERYAQPLTDADGVWPLLGEYLVAHLQLLPRALWHLARGADVLHLHNPPDTLFPAALVARLLGRRVVFDQHDLAADLFEAKFGRSPLVGLMRALQAATVRSADLVLATNESQRRLILDSAGARPVALVRNGPRREAIPADVPLRPGRLGDPHLLYVGVLSPQDGVDHLPDLLWELVHEHGLRHARLTIVGFGSREAALRRAFQERGLAAHTRLTGRLRHDEVLRIIASADICLDTAECNPFNHRSTMVKISEYLAFGRPTVAFALRESMRTAGDAACFATCGDWAHFGHLVAELAGDGERRRELGRRARARGEDLVWERSESELLSAYGQLTRAA